MTRVKVAKTVEENREYGYSTQNVKSIFFADSYPIQSFASSLFSLFSFPVQILSGVIRYIFGSLRIPIPLLYFPSLNFHRLRPSSSDPRGGTDRWIRHLEEETGAVCIGRARNSQSAITSSTEVGPSSLTSRSVLTSNDNDGSRKLLPDFFLASYEEALRICQKDARLACVILVSEEHDDVAEFKKYAYIE
jgi:FAS-associated factor 2